MIITLIVTVRNEALRLQPPVPSNLQRAPAVGSGDKALGPNMYESFLYFLYHSSINSFDFKGLSQKARPFKYPLMSFIGTHDTSSQIQINSGRTGG